ncbi:MAG: metallophosphoesterase [Eubacteriales bacterium]
MNDSLKNITDYVLWNNTMVLDRGISLLCTAHENDPLSLEKTELWGLGAVKDFVERTARGSIDSTKGICEFYPQNLHYDLFRFLKLKNTEEEYKLLSAMMVLHKTLTLLEEEGSQDRPRRIHLDYELLCTCLTIIAQSDMAYLVAQDTQGTYVLAGSSIPYDLMDKTLQPEDCHEILENKYRGSLEEEAVISSEYPYEIFQIDQVHKREYTLILQWTTPQQSQLSQVALQRKRNTLFLRGRISAMVRRDFHALLNRQQKLESIAPEQPDAPLNIFHISDIHAEKGNSLEIMNLVTDWKGTLDGTESKKIDFLAITGDVVQGRDAASGLEENYKKAGEIIRNIAFQLWKKNLWQDVNGTPSDDRLSQSWILRTLITTGNHDYATMNELESLRDRESRSTTGGRPASTEGSAMVKFGYFADFMRKLLHLDVGDLVDNELNEFRLYGQANLGFLVLNSSYMANSFRNNKVHIPQDFVEKSKLSLKKSTETHGLAMAVICLSHHGPLYNIDYLADKYYGNYIGPNFAERFSEIVSGHNFYKSGTTRKMQKHFEALKRDITDTSLFKKDKKNVDPTVQMWMLRNNPEVPEETIYQKIISERKQSIMYDNLCRLSSLDPKQETWKTDERLHRIISDIQENSLMSQQDNLHHTHQFKERNQWISACLSGHTHKARAATDSGHDYEIGRFFEESLVKEQDKLLRKQNLQFGILQVTTLPTIQIDYQFYQYFSGAGHVIKLIFENDSSTQSP